MSELLPCPMCGSEPVGVGFDEGDVCAYVECGECGLSMPEAYDEYAAAEAWNRRHTPEGWQCVPVEPSWNMLAANGCKKHHEGQECLHHENRKRIWQAMLKAAPKP